MRTLRAPARALLVLLAVSLSATSQAGPPHRRPGVPPPPPPPPPSTYSYTYGYGSHYVRVAPRPVPYYAHRARPAPPPPPPAAYAPPPPPRAPASHTGTARKRRGLDREDSLAIGVSGGSYLSGYDHAAPFADPGVGALLRYRPDESVGLQGSIASYGLQTEDSRRLDTLLQGSAVLFAQPESHVSPYVLGGITYDARRFDDAIFDRSTDQTDRVTGQGGLFGPHIGAGVEFAVGKTVAFDLDAKYTAFLGSGADDPTLPGALQTGMGVVVHF